MYIQTNFSKNFITIVHIFCALKITSNAFHFNNTFQAYFLERRQWQKNENQNMKKYCKNIIWKTTKSQKGSTIQQPF